MREAGARSCRAGVTSIPTFRARPAPWPCEDSVTSLWFSILIETPVQRNISLRKAAVQTPWEMAVVIIQTWQWWWPGLLTSVGETQWGLEDSWSLLGWPERASGPPSRPRVAMWGCGLQVLNLPSFTENQKSEFVWEIPRFKNIGSRLRTKNVGVDRQNARLKQLLKAFLCCDKGDYMK